MSAWIVLSLQWGFVFVCVEDGSQNLIYARWALYLWAIGSTSTSLPIGSRKTTKPNRLEKSSDLLPKDLDSNLHLLGKHRNYSLSLNSKLTISRKFKINSISWGCTSIAEHLPNMCKTLGLSSSTTIIWPILKIGSKKKGNTITVKKPIGVKLSL